MTWNVRSLRDDRSALVDVVREVRPDVWCIQEAPRFVRSRSRLAALARATGMLFVCGGQASAGTALLVAMRVQVRRSVETRFPRRPRLHRRGLAAADVELGGLRLAVGSIHLGLDSAERVEHAAAVRHLLAELGCPSTLVAGDLNEPPGRATWRAVGDGLVDVAGGRAGASPTYPAGRPASRIDAVFVSPDVHARAIPVGRHDLARASDHLPVVVDVALPGAD